MDTLVQLENITKRYEGAPVAAVDDISLRIAAGEAVALMGPSGSGKSTSWAANSRTATALRTE